MMKNFVLTVAHQLKRKFNHNSIKIYAVFLVLFCIIGFLYLNYELLLSRSKRIPIYHIRQDQCEEYPHEWDRLTYPLPPYFPMPQMPIVLETKPGTCDLFNDQPPPNICTQFSQMYHFEPDPHNREALATALYPCLFSRDCYSIDVGANIGYFTLWMAGFGSSEVVAIEPQPDLADALHKSIAVNCLTHTIKLFHGFATANLTENNEMREIDPHAPGSYMYRMNNEGDERFKEPAKLILPKTMIPMVAVEPLMRKRRVDLIKIDTDSVDGSILNLIIELSVKKEIEVVSIITEWSGGADGFTLKRFHDLGYDIYRLNIVDDRRHFDSKGNDTISNFGDIDLEPYYEERYFAHFMKWALFLKPSDDMASYHKVSAGRPTVCAGCIQFLITKLNLLEPHHEHVFAKGNRRPHGISENKNEK